MSTACLGTCCCPRRGGLQSGLWSLADDARARMVGACSQSAHIACFRDGPRSIAAAAGYGLAAHTLRQAASIWRSSQQGERRLLVNMTNN